MASNILFALLVVSLAAYAAGIARVLAKRRTVPSSEANVTWDAGHALCAFGLFMVFSAASTVAASVAARKMGYQLRSPQALAIASLLVYVFNVPTLLVLRRFAAEKQPPGQALGFGAPLGPSVRLGVAAFLAYLPFQLAFPPVMNTLWVHLLNLPPPRQDAIAMILQSPWLPMLLMIFSAAVIAPVYEEVIFRAFIQKGIEKSLGKTAGICVTSVVFASVHANPLAILSVLPFSFALSILYDRSRNILANILFHAAFNLTSLAFAVASRHAGLDLGI